MRPARHFILILLFSLSDIIVFNLSLLGSLFIVLSANQLNFITYISISFNNNQLPYSGFLICTNLFLLFVNYIIIKQNQSTYSHNPTSVQNIKNIIQTSAGCLLAILSFSYLFNIQDVTIVFINYFTILFCISLFVQRFIRTILLNFIRSLGYNNRNIAVVGFNNRSIDFIKYLQQNTTLGFNVLGFIDDQNKKFESSDEYPVICSLTGFKDFIRYNTIDEIAIFLPVQSQYNKTQEIINICLEHGILVRYSSNIFDTTFSTPTRFSSVQVDNLFFVTIITGKIDGWTLLIKRLFDIFVATVLLVCLSPLFLIVSIAIKISSPGPAFFVQTRIGLNKRKINLYKFRTMIIDAENQFDNLQAQNEADGPVFKIRNDPRIIPIGTFLRKSSIDELPQLFNVLLGNLSLVGPRPLPVRDFEGFYKDIHRRRFSVKPGITCTWQISGRHDISFENWMKLDLDYIDNWSLWLDLKILLGTIPAVLKFSKAS